MFWPSSPPGRTTRGGGLRGGLVFQKGDHFFSGQLIIGPSTPCLSLCPLCLPNSQGRGTTASHGHRGTTNRGTEMNPDESTAHRAPCVACKNIWYNCLGASVVCFGSLLLSFCFFFGAVPACQEGPNTARPLPVALGISKVAGRFSLWPMYPWPNKPCADSYTPVS